MPTSTLSLYALSSFFVSIIIFEFRIKAGWTFYAASCLLSLIVVQVKIRLVPYVLFFGLYGIIKYYIERINNIVLEYILKILYFNICLFLGILFIEAVFLPEGIIIKFPIWAIVAALEIIFLVYDYTYTLFINYYNVKLKKILKI
jgi:hypothetical protein